MVCAAGPLATVRRAQGVIIALGPVYRGFLVVVCMRVFVCVCVCVCMSAMYMCVYLCVYTHDSKRIPDESLCTYSRCEFVLVCTGLC